VPSACSSIYYLKTNSIFALCGHFLKILKKMDKKILKNIFKMSLFLIFKMYFCFIFPPSFVLWCIIIDFDCHSFLTKKCVFKCYLSVQTISFFFALYILTFVIFLTICIWRYAWKHFEKYLTLLSLSIQLLILIFKINTHIKTSII